MLQESLAKMASVHVSNFHSAYLFYPILDPHGVVNSGIATFSKYKIDKVIRKSLEITDAFPSKFFDLDRCFSASYLKTNHDNYLVIVNVHLSAYDKGGVYRKKQLQQLNSFLEVEYQKVIMLFVVEILIMILLIVCMYLKLNKKNQNGCMR